jgi:VCBS repeat protein
MRVRIALFLAAALIASAPAFAQFNVQWVEYRNETAARLVSAPLLGVSDPEEKDYAWGDVNRDGWTDLVVVRKQPFTSPGRDPNVLFMNENGVLTDRTAQYASDSDVPGDQGFLTATNDRDVVLADFNGDGWLDIATAVTISDGLPKHISHPRIYVNKGAIGRVWQGFRFEANRSPQLYVLLPNGDPDFTKPQPGRFCSIAAGDVDLDGDLDLFLGDYDSSGAGGIQEPPGIDLNDRLWINDGNGFFSDSYQTRMNAQMLLSAFSNSAAIADMNNDGLMDVIKDTALNPPQYVAIAYNRPPNDNRFDIFDTPHTFSPYFVSVGDLNNDGRLDMVVTDDNADRYDLNTGNDGLGRALFPVKSTFLFPAGAGYGDDGFGSQSLIADLDQDGWKDVLISDVDVDIGGCTRRMHIYHNLGGAPNVTLREEAQQAGSGSGWKGAVGFSPPSVLQGTHNVAAFDIDRDGDKDLVIGRCTGTSVWMNISNPCKTIRYGTANNNSTGQPAVIGSTGVPALSVNNLTLTAIQLPPGTSGFFFLGKSRLEPCQPYEDGLRCVGGFTEKMRPIGFATANGAGQASLAVNLNAPVFAGVGAGVIRYIQFRYADPSGGPFGYNYSDALEVHFCE